MRRFAAFDIDGTLIRWQLFHTVVDELARAGHLGPEATTNINEARNRWRRRESSDAFSKYEMLLVDLFESNIKSINPSDFDKLINHVVDENKDRYYVYTKQLFDKLQSEGYFMLAVTGSHSELIDRLAAFYKLDAWAGAEYERVEGAYSGRSYIPAHHKGETLKKLIKEHDLTFEGSLAIGDSYSDSQMLELVENPIAFNPERRLYDRAVQEGWKIVIERKNVIYELENDSKDYKLKLN